MTSRTILALFAVVVVVGCKKPPKKEEPTTSPSASASTHVAIPPQDRDRLPTITHWPPKGAAPHRAILLVHGGGGPELVFNQWMRPYTEALAAANYDVYMPHYFQRKTPSEIETARLTVSFIAKQEGVAIDKIGALGFSRGGFLTMELAADDARIRAAVELYGGMHKEQASRMTRMPPTLILHGDKDPIVPVDNAYDLKRLFDQKKVDYEMHIYPGEEHGFGGEALTDSVKRMVAFFDSHLY